MSTVTPAPAQRLAPGDLRESGVLAWTLAHLGGRRNHSEPINLFLVLGRNKRLFRGWLKFAGRLMPFGGLPRKETELVILRVAHLTECAYERGQHEHIARTVGLSSTEIDQTTRDDAPWSPRRRAILGATDQLVTRDDLDDEAWSALREHLDDADIIELVMLATHYRMLATTIHALRIQPEQRTRD